MAEDIDRDSFKMTPRPVSLASPISDWSSPASLEFPASKSSRGVMHETKKLTELMSLVAGRV